jgi:hypothetical protein
LLRSVEPELADHIPADDPRAIRFRRDLKLVNAVAMSDRAQARSLLKYWGHEAPRTWIDIGTGDGTVMLNVARRLAPQWTNVTLIVVDQQDIVSRETREGFAALGWKFETAAADVFEFLNQARPGVDIITANAFLHHFTEEQLKVLFARSAKMAKLFLAHEPRRTKFARECCRMLWILGCGEVACYDAVVSVRAGFIGKEMSALWPAGADWQTDEREAGPFLHFFAARRR